MKISICVPTYNALEYTKMFLDTLKHTDSEYELVMVDDMSTDGTREFLKTLDCKLLLHQENKGISATWNDLIDLSTQDYICICNSDILFTPHWDTPLIEKLKEYDVASPYHTNGELPGDFPLGKDRITNPIPVLGSCFMFKRTLIDKIGKFPENLRLWYGDNWLGTHALCVQVPESYIHHFISKSANPSTVKNYSDIVQEDYRNYQLIKN
jgi:glycosyltransferase involved in cell wall biosynthesis